MDIKKSISLALAVAFFLATGAASAQSASASASAAAETKADKPKAKKRLAPHNHMRDAKGIWVSERKDKKEAVQKPAEPMKDPAK